MRVETVVMIASVATCGYLGYAGFHTYGVIPTIFGVAGGVYAGSYIPKALEFGVMAVALPFAMLMGAPRFHKTDKTIEHGEKTD